MEGDVKWHPNIEVMNHRDDFTFPVLKYVWGTGGGLTGGHVSIWPTHLCIVVKSQRKKEERIFDSVSQALAAISLELTKEVPSGMKEAFEAMVEIRKAENIKDTQSAQKVFDEIKSRWEELIPSAMISS
jgi:hypothetical protein